MSEWRDPHRSDEAELGAPERAEPEQPEYGMLSDSDAGVGEGSETVTGAGPARDDRNGQMQDPEAVASLVEAIEARMEDVRRLGEDLSRRESSMSERLIDIDRRAAEFAAKMSSVDAERARVAARESELREREEASEKKEAELKRRMEEAEARLASIEARESELADRDTALCDRAQTIEERASTLHEQDSTIADRAQTVDERARALEEAERENAALRQELEAEREKLREAAQKLKQERAALAEMKSMALENSDRSLEERERELAQMHASIEMERERLEDQWREFEAQKQSMLDGSAPALTTFEQQQRFEDRERELEEARSAVEAERERLETMTDQLRSERANVKRERSSVEVQRDRGAAMEAMSAAMDRTIEECRVRRERLRRVRIALREREEKLNKAREVIRGRHKECERVLAMRDRVSRAQEELETQRAVIERRANRYSAVGALMKLTIAIAILGGLSWAVADRVAPTTDLVRATIAAQSADGALDAESAQTWAAYCASLATDPRLIEEASERFRQRGVEELSNPGAVKSYLDSSLDIDQLTPGELGIAIQGEGVAATQRVLETYLAAFVSIANDARGLRADQMAPVVRSRPAASGPPLRDDRLLWAGVMWGGSTLLLMMIGWALWSKLASSARRSSEMEPLGLSAG